MLSITLRYNFGKSGIIGKLPQGAGSTTVIYHGNKKPCTDFGALWNAGRNIDKIREAAGIKFDALRSVSQKVTNPINNSRLCTDAVKFGDKQVVIYKVERLVLIKKSHPDMRTRPVRRFQPVM